MDPSMMVKRIVEWKPMGSRRTGRPRIRWLDDVRDDLKVMNVTNWTELPLKGRAWNDLVD
jgi:hypothetical protein